MWIVLCGWRGERHLGICGVVCVCVWVTRERLIPQRVVVYALSRCRPIVQASGAAGQLWKGGQRLHHSGGRESGGV